MDKPVVSRLLIFARELQKAATFAELLETARVEVLAAAGYAHVWLFISDNEQVEELRLIDAAGAAKEQVWEFAPLLKIKGDAFLEEVVTSDEPVVIEDARVDPRTDKAIVERLKNRTIVNIPLRLLDKPFGVFGMGTFGDEGCRPPTREQLDYLIAMGSQLSVAVGRIRFLAERAAAERERLELERRIGHMQRLESLGMLAGGIAHDFNNLLTIILAGSAVVRRAMHKDITTAEAAADSVIDAAERGRGLTKQLLSMSREQNLDLKPTDVNERLRLMVALIARVFPATIEIDLIEGARLPVVHADTSQLDQVFMNVCLNARDAMPDGGRLSIETEQVVVNGAFSRTHPWAKTGRYVLVTVTDTGVGISRENVDRIFEPFFTTKKERGGTGLGLAVAYGVVRQHGGMFQCYSELGVGTSFKIYLPAYARAAADVGTKIAGVVVGGHERVLVAEDDPGVRAVTEQVLKAAGYDVTSVESGEAACERIEHEVFDLVILDLVMRGIGGGEALERIRSRRPSSRFLLSSGYSGAVNARPGDVAFLEKPYDPDALLRVVRQVLDEPAALLGSST